MSKEFIISKGRYSLPQVKDIVSVSQYFFVRDSEGSKRLLIRFKNDRSELCTGFTFKLFCLDSRGKTIEDQILDTGDISLKGNGSYTYSDAIAVSEKCTSFRVEMVSVSYGSYLYSNENEKVSVEYTDAKRKATRPFISTSDVNNARTITVRNFKLPWSYVVISLALLAVAILIIGIQLAVFKKNETEFTIEGVEYEFLYPDKSTDEVIITGCSGRYTNILIPSEIEGYAVVGIKENAFAGNKQIQKVKIEGVNVGDRAFMNCSSLTEVQIDGISSIGDSAFKGCSSLKSIAVTNSNDEEILSIGKTAFAYCTSLETVSIGQMAFYNDDYDIFEDDFAVKSLYLKNFAYTIPGYEGRSVENSIKDMFDAYYSSYLSLETVSIDYIDLIPSSFLENVSSLKSFSVNESSIAIVSSNAFNRCTNLSSVSFKSPVLSVGAYSFYQTAITSFDGSALTSIGNNAFQGCAKLSNFNWTGNTTLNNIGVSAFEGCSLIETITVPGSVMTIGRNAFKNCGVKTFMSTNQELEIEIGMLEGCTKVEELSLAYIPGGYVGYIFGSTYQYQPSELATKIPSSLKKISITGTFETLEMSAFAGCRGLQIVNLPQGIKTISDYAFYDCRALVDVNLGNSVEYIGAYAFASTAITTITIPSEMTEIADSTFANCEQLASVQMPQSITTISSSAFLNCKALEEIDLTNVTTINTSAFSGSGLKRVTVSPSVQYVGSGIFAGCNSIEEMTVPFTEKTRIAQYFGGYSSSVPSSLKKVTVNGGRNVESGAFDGCTRVNEIILGSSVVYIEYGSISYLSELRKLVIGENVSDIESGAILDCVRLYEICNLSGCSLIKGSGNATYALEVTTAVDSAPTMEIDGYKFAKYDGTWYLINWASDATEISPAGSFLYTNSLNELYTVSSWNIPHHLFYEKNNITKITLPSAVNGIGTDAFRYCTGAEEINFSASSGITSIDDGAFYGCNSLESITLPDSVVSIGSDAFKQCRALKSITLPQNTETIGDSAFYGCYNLAYVKMYQNVKAIGTDAFYGCSGLYDVYYTGSHITLVEGTKNHGYVARNAVRVHTSMSEPLSQEVTINGAGTFRYYQNEWVLISGDSSATTLNTSQLRYNNSSLGELRILEYAFEEKSSLNSIVIGSNVTQIHEGAFSGCRYLATASLESSSLTQIEKNTFYGCTRLREATIPYGVTTIGVGAFKECPSLISFKIPSSVNYISEDAFYGCRNLLEVYDLTYNLDVGKGSTSNGYVGYYAYVVYTSEYSGPLQRYNSNGCYFINCGSDWYLYYCDVAQASVLEIPTKTNTVILSYAFRDTSITSTVMPTTVKSISATGNSNALSSIYYYGTSSNWNSVEGHGSIYGSVRYYVSCVHEYGQWTYRNGQIVTSIASLNWSVYTQPTCIATGREVGSCEYNCGYAEYRTLDTVDHNIVNNACTYCNKQFDKITESNIGSYQSAGKISLDKFQMQNGQIVSTNQGQPSTTARLTYKATKTTVIIIKYSVSSESNYDMLRIKVGTSPDYASLVDAVSGTGGGEFTTTVTLSAGQSLFIEYYKDSSGNSGNDTAYIKELLISK